jgi:bifunctional DNase/RNase
MGGPYARRRAAAIGRRSCRPCHAEADLAAVFPLPARITPMALIPCYLSQILIDENGEEQVVFVSEREGSRRIPIVIGQLEATAIDRAVKGQKFPRPLTHDLVVRLLESLEATCSEVRIIDLREGTFYAELVLRTREGRELHLDCRPSDALALMVRLRGVNLAIEEAVLAEAGT